MLSRIFGWDKDKIKELERRLSHVEESLRQSGERQEEVRRRAEVLESHLARVKAADAKLAQGLIELVKALEQSEDEIPAGPRDEVQWSPSPEVESQILRILKDSGPATPRVIAEKLGKTREHLSRTLKSMAARGKITRQQDGRVFVYSIVLEP